MEKSRAYIGKREDPILISIIREKSLLGELEKKICNTLNLTEPHQHKFSPLGLLDYNSAENVKTGIMNFAKESPYGAGQKLKLITNTIENFYKDKGFETICESEQTHKPCKGLSIPEDYFKSKFITVNKGEESYTIQTSQGDEYSIYITNSGIVKSISKFLK